MGSLLWDAIQYVSSSTFVNGVTMIGGAISLVTSLVAVLVVIRVVRSLPPNSGFSVHLGLGGLRMRFIRGESEQIAEQEVAISVGDDRDDGDETDPETFTEFVERHRTTLMGDARGVSFSTGLPKHEAEDLLQDALAALADRWETARVARRGPRAYLHGVMHNLARRRWRSRNDQMNRRAVPLPDAGEDEADEASATEDALVQSWSDTERLRRAVARLTAARREVIVLVYLLELSIKEAADRLGKSPSAVSTLLSKALQDLRRFLNEDEGGTS